MNLKAQRAAALKAAQEVIKKAQDEGRDLKADEIADVEKFHAEIKGLDEKIGEAKKSADLIAELAGADTQTQDEANAESDQPTDGGGAPKARTLGERFVKSAGMKALRTQYGSAVRDTKNPIYVEARDIANVDELGIGSKATITTVTGQPTPNRLPGYRSELLDEPLTFLSLISTGTTDSSWLEYAQIVSETDNAAIVPEGELKPLSDVTTAKAEAKAHVYADGFDITNQMLADDGAIATFMETRIRQHVNNKVEDVLINGDVTANVKGILTTSGVQAQAYDTDVITTIAGALAKIEKVQATPQAIVMNPADAWKLSLTKEAGVGFLMGNPLQQGLNPTPFGVPLVKSNRVKAGTFLVGNFKSVQFLQREALSVVAFNQHKDYAQRNLSYVRAELRGLQLLLAPREIVVGKLSA